MKLRHLVLLAAIVVLALILRCYSLGVVPNGFHRDEVFLGYNAYSILTTGKDINGNFLPTHLASFLYTPAGYSYFSVPFIKAFGLSEFSVRFASAIFGAATIVLLYFVSILFFEKIISQKSAKSNLISLVAAFFLAISPWHINLSRTASTSTLVFFFMILGLFLFLKWAKISRSVYLYLSYLFYFVSLFFYVAPYSFLPLLLPVLYAFYYRDLKDKKLLLNVVLFVIFIILPLVYTLSSPSLSLRVRTVGITGGQIPKILSAQLIGDDGVSTTPALIARVFHNKPVIYTNIFLTNYFSHFSYDFLFSDKGFPDRYRIPLSGLLYLIDLPLFIIGGVALVISKKKHAYLLFAWLLLSPVGSALTFDDVPNLQRTLFLVFPIALINAYAVIWIWDSISKKPILRKCIFALGGVFLFWCFIFYVHEYYIHGKLYRPWYRQDGYKELVTKVNKLEKNYKKIVVTNRESGPTLFFLFYLKYDSLKFQQETKNTIMRDFDRIGFGKYVFSEEECPLREIVNNAGFSELSGEKDTLYVNSSLCKISTGMNLISSISRADGSKAFHIVEK